MNRISTELDGRGLAVGIAAARFNETLVMQATEACVARLRERGVADADIDVVTVPGALELPLTLQMLAAREQDFKPRYHALIALGAVIRGETYHFEVVANESARGVMDVSLHSGVPIANGILTANTEAQAEARASIKGAECADAAIEMALIRRALAA